MTRIPNLFLASDYVRTFTDLATMEAANEAARRAVNGILRAARSNAEPSMIWNLHEPEPFLPLRAYDRVRFRKGLSLDGASIGALIAEPERKDLDAFNRFGYFLGAAFQIQDDVLNLTGDQRKYGKEIGGDLLEGKRTLILSHLFANISPHERGRIQALFGKPRGQRLPREVAWLRALVEARGSIEYARDAARTFSDGARRELSTAYAGALHGSALDFIESLVEYVLGRDK